MESGEWQELKEEAGRHRSSPARPGGCRRWLKELEIQLFWIGLHPEARGNRKRRMKDLEARAR